MASGSSKKPVEIVCIRVVLIAGKGPKCQAICKDSSRVSNTTWNVFLYSLQNPCIPASTGRPFEVRNPPANPPAEALASNNLISNAPPAFLLNSSAAIYPVHPQPVITTVFFCS